MSEKRVEKNPKPGHRAEVPKGRTDGRVQDGESGFRTNMLRVPRKR